MRIVVFEFQKKKNNTTLLAENSGPYIKRVSPLTLRPFVYTLHTFRKNSRLIALAADKLNKNRLGLWGGGDKTRSSQGSVEQVST